MISNAPVHEREDIVMRKSLATYLLEDVLRRVDARENLEDVDWFYVGIAAFRLRSIYGRDEFVAIARQIKDAERRFASGEETGKTMYHDSCVG
jgi:hypothetical protein